MILVQYELFTFALCHDSRLGYPQLMKKILLVIYCGFNIGSI